MKRDVQKAVLAAAGRYIRRLVGEVEPRIKAVETRLTALDGTAITKSLDFAVYDTVTELAERLENLEGAFAELADNGFRYRGYYRDGMTAKRGEAYTHDGSLWFAIRQTSDRPGHHSTDWNLVARKGKDAT